MLRALGWGGDTAAGWRRILGGANSYTDLEPALLGRVEELIDFVTTPGTSDPPMVAGARAVLSRQVTDHGVGQ